MKNALSKLLVGKSPIERAAERCSSLITHHFRSRIRRGTSRATPPRARCRRSTSASAAPRTFACGSCARRWRTERCGASPASNAPSSVERRPPPAAAFPIARRVASRRVAVPSSPSRPPPYVAHRVQPPPPPPPPSQRRRHPRERPEPGSERLRSLAAAPRRQADERDGGRDQRVRDEREVQARARDRRATDIARLRELQGDRVLLRGRVVSLLVREEAAGFDPDRDNERRGGDERGHVSHGDAADAEEEFRRRGRAHDDDREARGFPGRGRGDQPETSDRAVARRDRLVRRRVGETRPRRRVYAAGFAANGEPARGRVERGAEQVSPGRVHLHGPPRGGWEERAEERAEHARVWVIPRRGDDDRVSDRRGRRVERGDGSRGGARVAVRGRRRGRGRGRRRGRRGGWREKTGTRGRHGPRGARRRGHGGARRGDPEGRRVRLDASAARFAPHGDRSGDDLEGALGAAHAQGGEHVADVKGVLRGDV